MDPSRPTRREFCTQGCRAMALAALGASVPGCGSISSPSGSGLARLSATVTAGMVRLAVDSTSPLAPVGSAAVVQSARGVFLVAHVSPDRFTALSSTCTHQVCTINAFVDQAYVCPCHTSRFDTSGRVLNGPAVRPLRQFPTVFADNSLTITL